MISGRAGFGLSLVAFCSLSVASAQELQPAPAPPATSTRKPPVERLRTAPTEYLLYQRAAYLAQQRTERIEGRKWAGISTARPSVPSTALATDVNPYLYPSWNSRYRGW